MDTQRANGQLAPKGRPVRRVVLLINGVMAGAGATYVITQSIGATTVAGAIALASVWIFLTVAR